MTQARDHALQPSPWLSVWFRPGTTIERVLAVNPKKHVLLLAILYAMAEIISRLIESKWTAALLDWRVVAAIIAASAGLGVVSLYVSSLCFRWAGRILRGRASPVELRAVLAWGFVPVIASYLIIFVAYTVLDRLQHTDSHQHSSAMNSALQAIVVLLALWSVIATMLMLARAQGFGFWRTIVNFVLGYVFVLLLLVIPLLIRTFLFQPFSVAARSMEPTLLIGDYLFVSKFNYGYSQYSLPFSPRLFSGRILAREPQRGDVVVFRLPRDDSVDYLKRLVGLPGDRIQMISGVLHINGTPVKHEQIEDFIETDAGGRTSPVRRWRETLPNGVSYTTLDLTDNGFYDNTDVYVVPEGHYFMLGDNLDNSNDSRVPASSGGVGLVPFENIIGRVEFIFFSIAPMSRGELPALRLDRLGLIVR